MILWKWEGVGEKRRLVLDRLSGIKFLLRLKVRKNGWL